MRRGEWDRQPLGQVPDVVLARALALRCGTVTEVRRFKKIPPFSYHGPRQQQAWVVEHAHVWVEAAIRAWVSGEEAGRRRALKWWRILHDALSSLDVKEESC